jgi:outer membrane scaffolding protein for murein synthesis (MipA/OmpV family)
MRLTTALKPMFSAAALATLCGAAHGQAFDAVRLFGVPAGDGEGTVGAAVIMGHEYLGSNVRRNMLFPALDYQWKNGWFAGTANGVGYQFDSAPNLQYGLRVTVDLGRSESRTPALAGMGDIEARPEASAFFNLFVSRDVFLTSTVRYGAGNDRHGGLLDLGAGYAVQLAPQWRTAMGVAATVANGAYMQSYFGVTSAQAQTSAYAPYSAGAGVRDVRASASLNYFITAEWTLTGAVTVRSLQGSAKNSPIVFEQTPVSGVAALTYKF